MLVCGAELRKVKKIVTDALDEAIAECPAEVKNMHGHQTFTPICAYTQPPSEKM